MIHEAASFNTGSRADQKSGDLGRFQAAAVHLVQGDQRAAPRPRPVALQAGPRRGRIVDFDQRVRQRMFQDAIVAWPDRDPTVRHASNRAGTADRSPMRPKRLGRGPLVVRRPGLQQADQRGVAPASRRTLIECRATCRTVSSPIGQGAAARLPGRRAVDPRQGPDRIPPRLDRRGFERLVECGDRLRPRAASSCIARLRTAGRASPSRSQSVWPTRRARRA